MRQKLLWAWCWRIQCQQTAPAADWGRLFSCSSQSRWEEWGNWKPRGIWECFLELIPGHNRGTKNLVAVRISISSSVQDGNLVKPSQKIKFETCQGFSSKQNQSLMVKQETEGVLCNLNIHLPKMKRFWTTQSPTGTEQLWKPILNLSLVSEICEMEGNSWSCEIFAAVCTPCWEFVLWGWCFTPWFLEKIPEKISK